MPPAGPIPYNLGVAMILLASAVRVATAAEPENTPTPSAREAFGERRLGELESRVRLDRSIVEEIDGVVVIDNESVRSVGERGSLTYGRLAARALGASSGRKRVAKPEDEPKRRAVWRKAVDEAREAIAVTEHELSLLDARIESLEDAAFDAGPGAVRLWAKYEEARKRRRIIEQGLKREQAELDAIIRRAREDGAEPGWFR